MIGGIFVKDLYSEATIDEALGRLRQLAVGAENLEDMLHAIRIDRKILTRTIQNGMEEYMDGLVELRHGWKPKMMDGNPKEKNDMYGNLSAIIKRMDEFAEPYVSAMRLVSDVALKQIAGIVSAESKQSVQEALQYQGARYSFDEQNVLAVQEGEIPTVERKLPLSVTDAYSQITSGFIRLKDLLNLLEDATEPAIYENVGNTNEFPEVRIGKCFETADEIDRTAKQIREGYDFLLKKGRLSKKEKNELGETAKLFKSLDRSRLTRATQYYAAIQFHEQPWDRAYNASIASLLCSVSGAAYSFNPFLERIQTTGLANEVVLFFASAAWTIVSGIAVYTFTDAGPKTAKLLRKLDEQLIRYRRV